MTFIISNFFQNSSNTTPDFYHAGWASFLRKAVKVAYLCIFVAKNFSRDFCVISTGMERTSLCLKLSLKIVREVKFLYTDLYLF